jgi:hypothetical protein
MSENAGNGTPAFQNEWQKPFAEHWAACGPFGEPWETDLNLTVWHTSPYRTASNGNGGGGNG